MAVKTLLFTLLISFLGNPLNAKQRSSAIDLLIKEMKRRGDSRAEMHLQLAAYYAQQKEGRKLFKHLRTAQDLGISQARISIILGEFYRRVKRYDAAFSTFLKILAEHPAQPYVLVQLWKTLYSAKLQGIRTQVDTQKVRNQLVGFGLHFPKRFHIEEDGMNRSKTLTVSGYEALVAGRNRHAEGLFAAAIDAMPSNARAHRGLGIARARLKNFARAAGAYLLYLELNPNAPDAHQIDKSLMLYWKRKAKYN